MDRKLPVFMDGGKEAKGVIFEGDLATPWIKGREKGTEGSMKSIVIEVIGAGGFLPF